MSMLENCQRGCLSEQPNVSKQNRSRLSSLRALHAVVAHPSLDGSADLEEYMEMIMPALLVNIQVPIDPAREPPAGEGPQPSLTTVSKEAESCLVEAMQGVNAANFWRIMRPFYKWVGAQPCHAGPKG